MHDLIEAHNTISFLKEHGISAKKRYGQNFLIDRRVLNRIIEGSNITDVVSFKNSLMNFKSEAIQRAYKRK